MATYDQIFRKNSYNLNSAVNKSRTWFEQQAKMLAGKNISPGRLIRTNPELNVTRIIPGELYMFQYDAKHKETLPYWDMFPLVFPFSKLPDGFIGLNMHYLPYPIRIQLLDKLVSFRSVNDEAKRLQLSWGMISGLSQQYYAQACVHRYLGLHIKSPLKQIPTDDWATAMMLPVERFVGSTKQRVWTDSLK